MAEKKVRFTMRIETKDPAYALSPKQISTSIVRVANALRRQSCEEGVSIHGYEGRVRDDDGNAIGKWSWEIV